MSMKSLIFHRVWKTESAAVTVFGTDVREHKGCGLRMCGDHFDRRQARHSSLTISQVLTGTVAPALEIGKYDVQTTERCGSVFSGR